MRTQNRWQVARLLCLWLLICWSGPDAYAAPQLDYSIYENANPQFTVELPTDWIKEENDQSLVFSGKQGTEQWQTTINFQLVAGVNQQLPAHVAEFKDQWKDFDPDYRLLSEQNGTLDGYSAISLRAQYHDPSDGSEVQQTQFLVQYPEFVFFIAYTAPAKLYDAYYPVIERVLTSFNMHHSGKSAPPRNPSDDKATQIQQLVEAAQLFREQNAGDGISGWRNYSDPELGPYVELLGQDIWPGENVAGGWAYFFALSMSNIGRLLSEVPVVAYYHPWSDVWLITEWALVPEPKIISAELLLGEWLRNKGTPPFDLEPDWLRGDIYRPAALARSVVNNQRSLDILIHNDSLSWQAALQLKARRELFDELNTQMASAELMASWSRAIEATRINPDSPVLKELLDESDSFMNAGITGQIDKKLRLANDTDKETIESIKAMTPEMFDSMNAVYWTTDEHAATLYLVPGLNSDFCLTLRFHRGVWGLNLKRIDLLYFPLILQKYRETGWP